MSTAAVMARRVRLREAHSQPEPYSTAEDLAYELPNTPFTKNIYHPAASAAVSKRVQKLIKEENAKVKAVRRSASSHSLPVCQRTAAMSPYERMLDVLASDPAAQKEVALGRRVGFYKLGKQLGAGNFSKVKLGVHCLTDENVAVKIMDKSKMDQRAQKLLSREIKTMEQLHHPNIIRLFECVETISRTYLVMEYAGGGELYAFVHNKGRLTEDECKPLLAQIVSAVAHMHSKNLVHRDIKAENVIFSVPGWVKLADFGFSCEVNSNERLSTFCGSPPYAAPELFKDQQYFGPNVDIWALGVLLYFMLVGTTPFRGETISDLKQCVLRGIYPLPDYISTFAQHAIGRMLVVDPKKRSTIHDVMKTHFLKDCKFTKPYLQCSTVPDDRELAENPVARKVWDTLYLYGINEATIKDAVPKGARNAVIGTYRIVLFQAQQDYDDKERNRIQEHETMLRGRKTSPVPVTRSKTCSIV